MVRFGQRLQRERRDAWQDRYVDYQQLKDKLKDIIAVQLLTDASHKADDSSKRVVDARKAIFQGVFDDQVKKVLGFYTAQQVAVQRDVQRAVATTQQHIADAESALLQSDQETGGGTARTGRVPPTCDADVLAWHVGILDADAALLEALAKEIAYLLQYIGLNLVALRKTVKKFAKNVAPDDPVPGYLSLEVGHPDDARWRKVQSTYLPAETAVDLVRMQQHSDLLVAAEEVRAVAHALQAVRQQLAEAGGRQGPAGLLAGAPATAAAAAAAAAQEVLPSGVQGGAADSHRAAAAVQLEAGYQQAQQLPAGGRASPAGQPPVGAAAAAQQVVPSGAQAADGALVGGRAEGGVGDRVHTAAGGVCGLRAVHAGEQVLPPQQAQQAGGGSAGDVEAGWWQQAAPTLEDALAAMEQAEEEAHAASALVRPLGWWERQAGVFEGAPRHPRVPATLPGLLVNCVSCFLYMANYAAVLPFVEQLCVHVGVGAERAGAVIGSADLANIAGTFAYSYWVTHSFKQPLLASSFVASAGNLLLIAAYQWRSYDTLLLARLITGLGSARSVNRQYIADFVPTKHRTAASAGFVMASTLGMSAGPLAALPLSAVQSTTWHGLGVNPVTAVGALFAALWLLGMLGTLLAFKEPALRTPEAARCPSADGATNAASLRQPLLPSSNELEPPLPVISGGELAAARSSKARGGVHASATSLGAGAAAGGGGQDRGQRGLSWPPVTAVVCLISLLLLKTYQQCYMDGIPLVAGALLGWGQARVGLYVGLVGLALLPVNAGVMVASQRLRDRQLLATAVLLSATGLVLMCLLQYSMWLYFGGGLLLFAGTIVWEASSMSLMSKAALPAAWRRPPLSDGLLTTQAGTVGRFAGNGIISLVAGLTGLAGVQQVYRFAQALHLLLAGSCGAVLLYIVGCWRQMDV